MTHEEIMELCAWSEPKLIETKRGWRHLLTADPTPEFSRAWRNIETREEMISHGIQLGTKYKSDKPEVKWWQRPAKEFVHKLQENIDNSRAVDASIVVPSPEGLEYLGYQRAGIAFARGKPGVLMGDEMGLGKTIEAIGVINDDPTIRKVVVICPAKLKINWHRELTKWLVRPMRVAIVHTDRHFPDADVWITNYEILHKFVNPDASVLLGIGRPEDFTPYAEKKHKLVPHGSLTYLVPDDRNLDHAEYMEVKTKPLNRLLDLVIIDEAHRIKEPNARQAQCARHIRARRRLALTGTPMLNKLAEVFELANYCNPKEFPNKFQFLNKYNGGKEAQNRLQLHLRSTVMVRRLKRDVLKDLPQKRRQVIEIPHAEAAVTAEMEMFGRFAAVFEDLQARVELAKVCGSDNDYKNALGALKHGVSAKFEEMAELRKQTALAKIPYVLDFVHDALSDDCKIITFGHHRALIEAVYNKFKDKAVIHYGGMSDAAAQMAVDSFQNDPRKKLFSGSILASGVGLTLTAAERIIFNEFDWRPGIMTQCEDRAHRIGALAEYLLIQILALEGSIDANMAYMNVEKQNLADACLDDGREALGFDVSAPTNGKHVHVNRANVDKQSQAITPAQIAAIHAAVKIIVKSAGVSGVDVRIGHVLASQATITPRQAVLGLTLVRKYQATLGADLVKDAVGKAPLSEPKPAPVVTKPAQAIERPRASAADLLPKTSAPVVGQGTLF